MKVVLLAPGLGSIVRGTERFCLDLAEQLRRSGLDARCWGTSEAPGVETLTVPGRVELQNFALARLHGDQRFARVNAATLHDWSIYAEDQLFAIPAALRLEEMFERGERVLVYARWQGGLVDPSGAPTQLLKVMARARQRRLGHLVVHTDYFYAPIASLLYSSGATLHSLGPWLTAPLLSMGVPDGDMLELPMCVDAARYRNCREARRAARRAAGIPEDAFVVLSVGAFDSTTPDKRQAHMLREIAALRGGGPVWWVVAGSRGSEECAWEADARRELGKRFVPLVNTPFERMADVYGMADLFALASLDETFGLVYVEAQLAGLPVVAHDTPVTRHICGARAAEPLMTLVDMRQRGAATAAIEMWRVRLSNGAKRAEARTALDEFARTQEARFGWERVGRSYAAAFRKVMEARNGGVPATGRRLLLWDQQLHRAALQLFENGRHAEALAGLSQALAIRESDERWNDWATVQLALSHREEAETGLRRALEISPQHAQALVNLGTLLALEERDGEAIPLLEDGSAGVDRAQAAVAVRLLESSQARVAAKAADAKLSARRAGALRILVMHENLPRFDQGGAEFRWMQVLRELRSQGHEVTYVAPRGFEKARYGPKLKELGIKWFADDARVLRREGFDVASTWSLEQVLREGQFDVALLYLWFWMSVSIPEHYVEQVRRLSPGTRVAVLTDDCHGLREMRAAELSGLWSDRERATDVREREIEILRSADIALAISDDDRRRLRADVREPEIGLLPLVVEGGPVGPGFDEREGLVFLADYTNPASRDGIEWYVKQVAPLVRQRLPNAKLYLAGVGMTPDLASGAEGVERVGFVADLAAEFAKRRILISPVRYGTGIKTKNLHAMAHGVPVVTTMIGAEGMAVQNGVTAMVADTPEEFARAVAQVYTDRTVWTRLAQRGREHILERFPSARLAAEVRSALERALSMRPRRLDMSHGWSVHAVERFFPEILNHMPAGERAAVRILAYVQAAEKLAAQGDSRGARRQLRHVFSFVPHRVRREVFYRELVSVAQRMERLYRELGDEEGAAEFRREARMFNPGSFPADAAPRRPAPARNAGTTRQHKSGKPKDGLEISVVIPTFNRRNTLAECLEALAKQSLDAQRFEVVVVDDGSTDGTTELCRGIAVRAPFGLHYLRQENAGAGAARRAAVAKARGKYLLLFNDDTIAAPDLLEVHLAEQAHAAEKLAVLGDFRLPAAARERALTHYLSSRPLLFPQITLEPGVHSKNAFFIASNLSVRRTVVEEVGSFDPQFRVAEDTELGVRLRQRGYSVLYAPEAKATHQHVRFAIGDLVRRAQVYGRTQLRLLRKHPQLLGDGTGPFGRLGAADIEKMRADIARRAGEVKDAQAALERFDSMDFSPFHARKSGDRTTADEVMSLFDAAVPAVFWFYLFESFVEAWDAEQKDGARTDTAAARECSVEVVR